MATNRYKCVKYLFIYTTVLLLLNILYTKTPDIVIKTIKVKTLETGIALELRQRVGNLISSLKSRIKGEDEEEKVREPKLILMYTPVFGKRPWSEWYIGDIKRCPLTNCNITYNRTLFNDSDLVVFHGRDLPGFDHMLVLHSQRPINQRWVFFVLESPVNTPQLSPYDNMFNWTTTFREDSDVFSPYDFYVELDQKKDIRNINFADNKTKVVAIMYSHCVQYRGHVVQALRDLNISVDTYGGCSDKPGVCGWNCPDFFKSYKFYLSFENSYCPDYITEKYWFALKQNMVPVVIGGANYSSPGVAVPGSFINALDFDSIQDLANYLNYLDKNDTAYNQYFAWQEKYYIGKLNDNSPSCKWCELLSDPETPSKVYSKMDDFWGRGLCKNINDVVNSALLSSL